jgi:hypothetical protein
MNESKSTQKEHSESVIENKITLYSLLTEQLFKHQTVIWQIPIALIVGNFLVLEKFPVNLYVSWTLSFFNFGMLFVWYRMIKSQKVIIAATRKSEEVFRETHKEYKNYLPDFGKKGHRIFAPYVVLFVLCVLELCLIVYNVFLFLKFNNIL